MGPWKAPRWRQGSGQHPKGCRLCSSGFAWGAGVGLDSCKHQTQAQPWDHFLGTLRSASPRAVTARSIHTERPECVRKKNILWKSIWENMWLATAEEHLLWWLGSKLNAVIYGNSSFEVSFSVDALKQSRNDAVTSEKGNFISLIYKDDRTTFQQCATARCSAAVPPG